MLSSSKSCPTFSRAVAQVAVPQTLADVDLGRVHVARGDLVDVLCAVSCGQLQVELPGAAQTDVDPLQPVTLGAVHLQDAAGQPGDDLLAVVRVTVQLVQPGRTLAPMYLPLIMAKLLKS
jgi:hypothetical protein